MKKELKILFFVIVTLTVLVLFQAQRFISAVFVIYQMAFYLWLVLMMYFVVDYITKNQLQKTTDETRINTIIVLRTVLIVVVMVVVAVSQITYIDKKDTLYTRRCEYYDTYGNMIYKSMYWGVCPELTIMEQDEEQLIVSVQETAIGRTNFDLFNDRGLSIDSEDPVTAVSTVSIEMKYNDDFDVEYYDIQFKEVIEHDGIYTVFNYHRYVETTYEGLFQTTVTEARKIEEFTSQPDMILYSFNEDDYTWYRLYEDTIPDDPVIYFSNHVFMKEEYDGENTTTDIAIQIIKSDTQQLVDVYYNVDLDERIFSELSMFYVIKWYSLHQRDSVNLQSTYNYSLDYEKYNNLLYIYRMGEITSFAPNYVFEDAINYLRYSNKKEDFEYLTNGTNTVIECHPTNYGMNVIEKRIMKFELFRSNDEQMEEQTFAYPNDGYVRLYDYYLDITDFPYYDPPFIMKDFNPLFLRKMV